MMPFKMRAAGALLAVASCGWVLAGCDSNPTPHPQADATVTQDALADTSAPNEGEYTDIDNAPDCATAGGFWDGNACRGDAGVAEVSEVEATVDVGDVGDVGEVADDLGDGAEVGDVEGDAGPDSAE